MRAAIHARVSTPRQGREQTIESQLSALREWVSEKGYELSPDDVYADEKATRAPGSTAPGWTPCATAPRTAPSR